MLVAGVRNKQKELWALVKSDVTGNGSFLIWVAAIAVVGGAGYIKEIRPLSIAFMTLLLLVLFLSNRGVITQLQDFVNDPTGGTETNPNTGTLYQTGLTDLSQINKNLQAFSNG